MKVKTRIACGVTAVTCLGLLAISVAVRADEIRGQGTVVYSGDPELDPSDALNPWRDHVAINAWIDDNGDAQGRIIWDRAGRPGR